MSSYVVKESSEFASEDNAPVVLSPNFFFSGRDRARMALMAKRHEGCGPWNTLQLISEISEQVQIGYPRVLSVMDYLVEQGVFAYGPRGSVRFSR